MEIGQRDHKDNLLVLGGHISPLWESPTGGYIIQDQYYITKVQAVEAYNKANKTLLPLDFIETWFEPWMASKQKKKIVENKPLDDSHIIATFNSKSEPGKKYYVRYTPERGPYCSCWPFIRNHTCGHLDQIRNQLEGEPK
jgi:hypothetical protein